MRTLLNSNWIELNLKRMKKLIDWNRLLLLLKNNSQMQAWRMMNEQCTVELCLSLKLRIEWLIFENLPQILNRLFWRKLKILMKLLRKKMVKLPSFSIVTRDKFKKMRKFKTILRLILEGFKIKSLSFKEKMKLNFSILLTD